MVLREDQSLKTGHGLALRPGRNDGLVTKLQ